MLIYILVALLNGLVWFGLGFKLGKDVYEYNGADKPDDLFLSDEEKTPPRRIGLFDKLLHGDHLE